MKRISFIHAALVGLITSANVIYAARIQPPIEFHAGTTEGWTAGRDGAVPTAQPDGGAAGAGDGFLMLTGQGGNGPGSIVAAFNDDADWTGDYAAASVSGVSVDLMAPANGQPLSMRLVLFGAENTNNRWTSLNAATVPNDGVWRNYVFPIAAENLTRVRGNSNYDAMMQDVVRIMLRHDSGTPSAGGSSVVGTLGLDRIQLVGIVPEPSSFSLGSFGFLVLRLRLRRPRSKIHQP